MGSSSSTKPRVRERSDAAAPPGGSGVRDVRAGPDDCDDGETPDDPRRAKSPPVPPR